MIHPPEIQPEDRHRNPRLGCNACGSPCQKTVSQRRPVVVKIGGDIASNDQALSFFTQQVLELKGRGKAVIVVHGGGPSINLALQREGIAYQFSQGSRITTADVMNVVQRTLLGEVNPRVVSELNRARVRSAGISGLDGHFIPCEQSDPVLGFVGRPSQLDPSMLSALLDNNITPVVAPIGVDKQGRVHNVNADTFAGFIAEKLQASALLILTNVNGVMTKCGTTLEKVSTEVFDNLVKTGSVKGGMTPKIQAALKAFSQGVPRAVIVDGRKARSAVRALEGFSGVGTHIAAP
ncbi:acetylglutamate kinase [Roseobacter cerasinus]|uniref:Acetylglutamate kinase n=1 Tax=Roseobacter cerasinus TaxID=2602289 RepID=A0A640VY29_9RHOB|nr:acetylglutamate kinase [Roseobacter cerasinus]GFE51855.1 acetylglutamate kinase [Roseobacter cerasinus]